MTKIDALGFKAGFSVRCYGVKIGIRSNDPKILTRVRKDLPGEWTKVGSGKVDRLYSILINSGARRFNHLYADHNRISRTLDVENLLASLDSDLRIFIAEFAKHRVFVHAGVVGWKGRAIVIPGRSFTGKSTLVAELIRAGASYYSDEYAVFDSRGRVHPFQKPLELRQNGGYAQTRVELSELGGRRGANPLPVGLVLMTHYREGARWRPRRLTPGTSVLQLLYNTVSARRDPHRALETLERVAANAEVLRGVRGNAENVVPAMLKRFDAAIRK
jgi:hypothetical protein